MKHDEIRRHLKCSKSGTPAKLVFVVLLLHAGPAGKRARPSVKLLAEECGMSERRVVAALAELRANGEIEARRKKARSGPNEYLIRLEPKSTQDENDLSKNRREAQDDSGVQTYRKRREPLRRDLEGELEGRESVPRELAPPKTRKPKSTDPPEGFDAFWAIYPRKAAKKKALKAWSKLAPNDALQKKILGGVARLKESPGWIEDGGRFIPHPSTFLNDERWEDEGVKGIEKMKGAAGASSRTPGEGELCPVHGVKWFYHPETDEPYCASCRADERVAALLDEDDENENEDAPGGRSVSTTAAGEGAPAVAVVAERALAAAGVGAAEASRFDARKAVAAGLNGSHGPAGARQGEGVSNL